jgi:hypothetical protein
MAEPIIIATPFTELGELAEHFAQRVDQGRLMLPCAAAIPDGEWVPFQVLYLDGSAALEGTGKVNGSYDNGEDSPPEYRFDVVLEELAFDGTSEVVFERITVARASMLAAEPATGEVSLAEVEPGEASAGAVSLDEAPAEAAALVGSPAEAVSFDDVGSEPEAAADAAPAEASPAEASLDEGPAEPSPLEQTAIFEAPAEVSSADAAELAAPESDAPADAVEALAEPSSELPEADASWSEAEPAAPPRLAAPRANPGGAPVAPGKLPNPHSFAGGVLSRPVLAPVWEPTPEARPDAAASSGLFDYAQAPTGHGVLPRPSAPPHPELPAELRIARAPAPAA